MTDKFLREKDILDITGFSRTTIWRLEQKGKFPKKIRITPRLTGWYESQINNWLKEQGAA